MAAADIVKVAATTSGKIMVHAKGDPATIVAVGAAAAIVFVGVGLGHGAYEGTRYCSKLFFGNGSKA